MNVNLGCSSTSGKSMAPKRVLPLVYSPLVQLTAGHYFERLTNHILSSSVVAQPVSSKLKRQLICHTSQW